MVNKKSVLFVYKERLGLPSIDYKCLQAILLTRMHQNHKVEIKTSGFYTTPHLPTLEYEGQFYTTQVNILKKLEEIENINLKSNIKKSRVEAYKALTHQTLEPCIALNFWGNEKNCQYLLKLYGSEKYFPFRLIYLRRLNAHVQDIVSNYSQGISNTNSVNEALESYLTDIAHLLTINKYLLGSAPSVLDAYVCAYLLPIYALNLPDKTLKTIIQRHDIITKYLINYLKYYNIKIIHEVSTPHVQNQDDDDRASLGLLATAGFLAVSLMIGYGIMYDIFKIR